MELAISIFSVRLKNSTLISYNSSTIFNKSEVFLAKRVVLYTMNQAISNKEKAFYIDPTFNNPTGQSLSRRSREEIITYSRRHNMPIIEDDIYRDIWFDEPPLKPIKSLDNTGNVLHISSFSKSIAPAIRIGWLIASEKVIEQLADIRMQIDYGSSILSQMVVYELLTSGEYDDHVSRLRTILKDKRDYMLSILNDTFSDIATWDIPKGGFFIWVTFRGDINIKKLFAELINKEKILLNPGFIYGGKANTVRLSYAFENKENIKYALQKIQHYASIELK